MKTIKVGIMSRNKMREYTKAIAIGKHTPKRGEPKVWFSSMAVLSQVLSDSNRELLSLIAEQKPESISELAELSGRAQSSVSRTLKKMERLGLVNMKRGKQGRLQPKVPYSDIVLDMSITGHAQGA